MTYAVNLGSALWDAYRAGSDPATLTEVATICRTAAEFEAGSPIWRIRAVRLAGAALAELGDWPTALTMYELGIGLLPQIATRNLPRNDQEYGLTQTTFLATEAATVAIMTNTPNRALSLLEEGRGRLLAQILDTHSDLTDLHAVAAPLATRLATLREQLT